jgi:DNA-binding MarR family transcriptional regulator
MNSSENEQLLDVEGAATERAADLLLEIGRSLLAGATRVPRANGRSLGQLKAAGYLARQGTRTVGEIAAGIGVAMPTASELVDRLVEGGLAERAVNPANRRQVHVWLTPAGVDLAGEIRAARQAHLRAALAGLSRAERDAFVRSLESVAEALHRQEVAGCPPAMDAWRR